MEQQEKAGIPDARDAHGGAIDLDHLARQTMGDEALAREVLGLFTDQLTKLCTQMASAAPEERRALSHTLKGSARGVGAFALADCAAAIERDPESDALQEQLAALAGEARRFIARRHDDGPTPRG